MIWLIIMIVYSAKCYYKETIWLDMVILYTAKSNPYRRSREAFKSSQGSKSIS